MLARLGRTDIGSGGLERPWRDDEIGEVAPVAPAHHLREFSAHRRTDYGLTAGLSSLLSSSSVCGAARPPKRVSISFRISRAASRLPADISDWTCRSLLSSSA